MRDEKTRGAERIQRVFRGFRARMFSYMAWRSLHKAARKIQSNYRMASQRRRYIRMKRIKLWAIGTLQRCAEPPQRTLLQALCGAPTVLWRHGITQCRPSLEPLPSVPMQS